jgi:hypothetical protein
MDELEEVDVRLHQGDSQIPGPVPGFTVIAGRHRDAHPGVCRLLQPGRQAPGQLQPYPLDILYRSGELFAFKGAEDVVPENWPLEIARWLAPGVTLFVLYEFIKVMLAE